MNQITTPTSKKRIEYIDALRGFTMILVVFSHVESVTFKMWPPSFINELLMSFRMPLFFFISGFIGYKANVVWNKDTWQTMSKKKLLIQLIPTLVIGLIYAYAYLHIGFNEFVSAGMKHGYWFTIVLLEMFLVVYTVNLLAYNFNQKIFKKRQMVWMIGLALLFFGCTFIINKFSLLKKLGDILCLHNLFEYFIYFVFGYICSMNKEIFYKILSSRYFSFVVILLFSLLFYMRRTYIYPNMDSSIYLFMLYHGIGSLLGFLGLLIVYNTFRVYQDSFTSDKKIGKALLYIGKRTLDIYLLHYFFLPVWPQLGDFFSNGKNFALELTLGGMISLIVIGLCLVVSSVLRTSPILGKYLFGAK